MSPGWSRMTGRTVIAGVPVAVGVGLAVGEAVAVGGLIVAVGEGGCVAVISASVEVGVALWGGANVGRW